jgi:hypothetical protein
MDTKERKMIREIRIVMSSGIMGYSIGENIKYFLFLCMGTKRKIEFQSLSLSLEMNTYFLSLLQSDRKREKNLATYYKINHDDVVEWTKRDIRRNHRFDDYLRYRFPRVERGDVVQFLNRNPDSYRIWTGTKTEHCLNEGGKGEFFQINHPFSYLREIVCLNTHVTDKLRKSKPQRLNDKNNRGYLLIPKFKIGKVKYDIVLCSKMNLTGEQLYREMEKLFTDRKTYCILSEPNKNIGDYLETYKKRLFIFLEPDPSSDV